MTAPRSSESGSVAIFAIFVLLLVATMAVSLSSTSATDLDIAANYRSGTRAFLGADGAAQAYFHDVLVFSRSAGRFPTAAELAAIEPVAPEEIDIVDLQAEQIGAAVVEPVQIGFYQGMYATTARFATTVTARDAVPPNGSATVHLEVDLDLIPLFQFLAFFEQDLVVSPLPKMTLDGRIHTNSDMYLGASDRLDILAPVTAAGTMHNHEKTGRGSLRGEVYIRDAKKKLVAMNGLDSHDAGWRDESLKRWGGNVHTVEHGVEPLRPAISTPDNPRLLIEPGLNSDSAAARDDKLYYAADVRIVNGRFYRKDGTEFTPVDPKTGASPLRLTAIYDQRDRDPMLTMEIDIAALEASGAFPANGLLYAGGFAPGNGLPNWPTGACACWGPEEWEDLTPSYMGGDARFAVKLTNGERLPDALTVVSENSVYIRGHYNAPGGGKKEPAAIMADSVTILSTAWGRKDAAGKNIAGKLPDEDWGYSNLALSKRGASNTTVYAAFLVGSQEIDNELYNGGLENLPKFMEDWTNVTFKYLGSMIHLWWARNTLGDWVYSPVYQAPKREWGFDTDFLQPENLPVATPVVASMRFVGWERR